MIARLVHHEAISVGLLRRDEGGVGRGRADARVLGELEHAEGRGRVARDRDGEEEAEEARDAADKLQPLLSGVDLIGQRHLLGDLGRKKAGAQREKGRVSRVSERGAAARTSFSVSALMAA